MELQHFSHDHPLIFEEEYKDDGVKVSCYGCQQPISGPCYFCRKYKDLFLHEVCAELPKEMKHPMHPEHQLNLLPGPPNYPQSPSSQSPCGCGVCGQPCKSFTYSCSLCVCTISGPYTWQIIVLIKLLLLDEIIFFMTGICSVQTSFYDPP